jgi:hypothetical protein
MMRSMGLASALTDVAMKMGSAAAKAVLSALSAANTACQP